MYPGGTPKVTFNRPDPREYEAMKRMQQDVAAKAIPEAVSSTRTSHGAVRVMPQDLQDSNFSQASSTANAPVAPKTTGKVGDGIATSSTVVPDQDPDKVQLDAILAEKNRRRLDIISKAASNAELGNNNRAQTMRA